MHRGISGRAASHYVRTSVFLHTERRKTWRPDKGTLGGPAGEQQVHHLELSPDGVPECADPDKNGKNGIQLCLPLEETSVHNEAEANTEGETT